MIYLLVTLDHLFRVSERVVAVSDVAEGASRVDERRGGGELLQRGQLLLQVPDGVLVVAHVLPCDAQVAECLSLHARVIEENKYLQDLQRNN